jgi:hypothetical protein
MARLTEHERHTVTQRLLEGESPTKLSREFPVSRQYLSSLKSKLRRRDKRSGAPGEFDYTTAKDELRRKAYPAVSGALDDASDTYKRGRIGLETLKGTGDLYDEQGGNNETNISILVANVPAGFNELMARHGLLDEEVAETDVNQAKVLPVECTDVSDDVADSESQDTLDPESSG